MSDLEKFAKHFDGAINIRKIKSGLEVRTMDLERGKASAERFIRDKKLNLAVGTEGSMPILKAFVIKEVLQ